MSFHRGPEEKIPNNQSLALLFRVTVHADPSTCGLTVRGVVSVPAMASEHDEVLAIVARSLYAAKRQGRNRVVVGHRRDASSSDGERRERGRETASDPRERALPGGIERRVGQRRDDTVGTDRELDDRRIVGQLGVVFVDERVTVEFPERLVNHAAGRFHDNSPPVPIVVAFLVTDLETLISAYTDKSLFLGSANSRKGH
jgi:hypothetical protein